MEDHPLIITRSGVYCDRTCMFLKYPIKGPDIARCANFDLPLKSEGRWGADVLHPACSRCKEVIS